MTHQISPEDFIERTAEENAQALADLLPEGIFWEGKNVPDSNLRKLLRAYGKQLSIFQANLYTIAIGYIPNTDVLMVDSWEELLGIPDKCFTKDGIVDGDRGSLQGRYNDILIKLAKMNLVTEEDYIALGRALGVNVSINNSSGGFNQYYFELIVNGVVTTDGWDYIWDFPWGSTFENKIICIFNQQRPANTLIKYTFV